MTAKALEAIGEVGGPRCCKRDSYLSISAAVGFVRENMGIEMEKPDIVCSYGGQNNQCIGKRCPFSVTNRKKKKIAFICVHNSCRSQIAEALGRKYLSDTYECYSISISSSRYSRGALQIRHSSFICSSIVKTPFVFQTASVISGILSRNPYLRLPQ